MPGLKRPGKRLDQLVALGVGVRNPHLSSFKEDMDVWLKRLGINLGLLWRYFAIRYRKLCPAEPTVLAQYFNSALT